MPQAIINSFLGVTPVEPDDFPNLEFWWKADSFSLADNDPIGAVGVEWQDQSVNNRDATQPTAGKRPLFKTNIFGSLPAIRFDGVDDSLNFPVKVFAASSELTFLIVGKAVTLTDCQLLGHDVENEQVRVGHPSATQVAFWAGTLLVTSTAFGSALTNAKLITWRRVLSAGNYDINFRENTTDRTTGGPEPGEMSLNRIGETSFGGNPNWDIGEIVGYSGLLSVAQVDALYTTYFKPKWGLP